MSRMRRLGAGIWEFFVGDDPWVAGGIVAAIGVTAILAGVGAPAWWVMPVAVLVVLGASLRRAP